MLCFILVWPVLLAYIKKITPVPVYVNFMIYDGIPRVQSVGFHLTLFFLTIDTDVGETGIRTTPFIYLFLLFTSVLFQWDFSHGKFWLPSPGKASCDRVTQPDLAGMLGVLVFP